jgi:pimeloyl-ACP methyl ester carboxylesterase
MVVLMASLQIQQLDWVGTSLGGLIGMLLAGRKNSPIRRLVINDAGPHLHPAAVFRIVGYVVDAPPRFSSLEDAELYFRDVLAPFGQLTDEQWQHLTRYSVHRDEAGRYVLHYDPRLTRAFRFPWTYETEFWTAWDNIRCPVLVLRGAFSDLLLPRTAREMAARNPRATIVEVPDTGHAPALADAEQLRLITNWLTQTSVADVGAVQ